MKILLVEDDAALAASVEEALTGNGHEVIVARDGTSALAATGYGMVLLDLQLPDIDGREVCRQLRRRDEHLPIIMVTAASEELDRVLGFELGADDYVVKPFSVRELLARVRALAKRVGSGGAVDGPQPIGLRVELDRRRRQVYLDGIEVHLTPKEFDVFSYLTEDLGAVCRRDEIIERVWSAHWFGPTKTLDAHVAALRRKLEGALEIAAVRGIGFRVDVVR